MSSTKRGLDDSSAPAPKKQKKGFQVGPVNLPDGTWRRKNQRIKRDLIEKAQIKKSYAKLKEREGIQPSTVRYDDNDDESIEASAQEGRQQGAPVIPPASLELHPDRQQMLNQPQQPQDQSRAPRARRERRWKPSGANGEQATQGDESGVTRDENGIAGDKSGAAGDKNGAAGDEHAQEETGEDHRQHPSRKRQTKPQPFSKETREAERKKEEAEQRAKEREEANLEKEHRLAERERHRKVMAKARTGGKNGQRKLGRESKVLLDKVKRLMGAT